MYTKLMNILVYKSHIHILAMKHELRILISRVICVIFCHMYVPFFFIKTPFF